MLDVQLERTLTEVTEQLRTLCGDRLLCVALYGSGVGPDHIAGSSDLNLVVVLTRVDRAAMMALRVHTSEWHKRGVATPLLIDPAFLQAAADVFPMELHSIKDSHRLLHGNDVFSALAISDRHLRYQCEHEARGKLLRLRQLYLEMGDNRAPLQTLMLDSLKTFLAVMRAVVRMHGSAPGLSYQDTLDRFCQNFGVSLPTMARLLQVKLGKERWSGDAESLVHVYIDEVEQVVQVVDQLKVD